MMSKGSKLSSATGTVNIASVLEVLRRFKDRMAMISLDVASLTLDLQALNREMSQYQVALDVLQDSLAKPTKTQPRTAKPCTSTRRKA